MVKICVIYDKLRFEEKSLHDKALKKGLEAELVDAKSIAINTETKKTLNFTNMEQTLLRISMQVASNLLNNLT